jgi:hypothetical protein
MSWPPTHEAVVLGTQSPWALHVHPEELGAGEAKGPVQAQRPEGGAPQVSAPFVGTQPKKFRKPPHVMPQPPQSLVELLMSVANATPPPKGLTQQRSVGRGPMGVLAGRFVPRHTPIWQTSLVVQALASSHAPPVSAVPVHALFAQTSLAVHGLLSLQVPVRGVPAQVPLLQVSLTVHGLLSSHDVASVPVQAPVAVQVSLTVQTLKSLQATGGEVPMQLPFWQVPVMGQPKPPKASCVQAVPLGRLVPVPQTPEVGSQTPVVQGLAMKAQRGKPWQTPASTQRSECVQRFPSSHGVPASAAVKLHCPVAGLQAPAPPKQGPGAGQLRGVPWQVPPVQRSPVVQALPSSQPASARNGKAQPPSPRQLPGP